MTKAETEILDYLTAHAGQPKTVAQIAAGTGRSYNGIQQTLKIAVARPDTKIEAVRLDGRSSAYRYPAPE